MQSSAHDIHALRARALRDIDRVCTRFEAAWKSGVRPKVEEYWEEDSAAGSVVLLKELLAVELDYRRRHGDAPSAQELHARFPQHSDAVSAALDDQRPAAPAEIPPPQIEGYEVQRRLGRGGMAVVYLARDLRLGRSVALKLISSVDPPEATVARFRAEAQAIARLAHPNIVQIYEIGEYAQRPYLALEYVDGASLSEWIAAAPRLSQDAAKLVEVLARAIGAAHQQGVVHRDLKPANVLLQRVGLVPKITDFGLAKFLDDADQQQTQSGVVVGTASYMAPEQAASERADIGQPADIYALGAILYELITGRPPFRAATVFETAMLVRHSEPVAPRQLQPNTPRDLETICLKCLEKQPARRYGSASELADDLRRFLNDEPVRARPVGAIQRCWRWSRRNRAIAALGAAVAGALLLGTAISAYFAIKSQRRAAENMNLARHNRALAEKEALARGAAESKEEQARKVLDYLVNTFQSADPLQGGRITVAESLDNAVKHLESDFGHDPAARAQLGIAIGQAYVGLGLHEKGLGLLEQSQRLLESSTAGDEGLVLKALRGMATALRAKGEVGKSLALSQQLLDRSRAAFGEDHEQTIEAMSTLAMALQGTGDLAAAAALHERALAWSRQRLGEDDPQTLRSLNNLAWVYLRSGRVNQAIAAYEIAFAASRRVQGPEHPLTLAIMNNLAEAYAAANQVDRSIELLVEVLAGARRQLGENHPHTLSTMGNLARAYRNSGKYDQALSLVRQTLELKRAALGEDHPDTINELASLAITTSSAGLHAEALPLFEKTLALRRAKLGEQHPHTLMSMDGLASAYRRNGDPARAAEVLRECLVLRQSVMPGDWTIYHTQAMLGRALIDLDKFEEAEALLLEAHEQMHARLKDIAPADRRRADSAAAALVNLYERWNKPDSAALWRDRARPATPP